MWLLKIRDSIIDLIFPPTCVSCMRVDEVFCAECLRALAVEPITPLYRESDVVQMASTGVHAGILANAVIALKYERAFAVVPFLADRIVRTIDEQKWTVDIVVPVPLHTTRFRERGYNQAKEISTVVAEHLGHRHEPDALTRKIYTHSQVGLSQAERMQNMQDVFSANSTTVSGKTLLLIDDVLTTGATIMNCAAAAMNAGAVAVYGITVTSAQV